jgi:hypothetical protein
MYKVLHCDCQTISEVYSRYSCSYLFHRATRIAIIADENGDLALKGLGREAFDLDVGVLAKHYFGKLHAAPSTAVVKLSFTISVCNRKTHLRCSD